MTKEPPQEITSRQEQPITVLLADSQSIYRVGIRKIFALEDDIRVVAQAQNLAQAVAAAAKFRPLVILLESTLSESAETAAAELLKRAPCARIVVVLEKAEQDHTVSLFRSGVQGIVTRSISPDLLVRCIRKVAAGETWLDNRGVSWVLEAYRSQTSHLSLPRAKTKLSDKELLIVTLVTQGLRNKEVAHQVGTTEQVIKNYLRKIYDKLGVADRLELALFSVHHGLLNGNASALQNAPAEVPTTARAANAG